MSSVSYVFLDVSAVEAGQSAKLARYWDSVRGGCFAPSFGKTFHLDEVGWDVLPNMSVVDVLDGGKDYRYRFWGTNNVLKKGIEVTGQLLSELQSRGAAMTGFAQFGDVLSARKPLAIVYEGEYKKYVSGRQICFRFPLSSDGRNIDKIVSYQALDVDPDDWKVFFNVLWKDQDPREDDRLQLYSMSGSGGF